MTKLEVSRRFQSDIYPVFHEESESEVQNAQILQENLKISISNVQNNYLLIIGTFENQDWPASIAVRQFGDPWFVRCVRDQTAHIITPAGWWSAFGMDGASASGASTGGERKRKGGRGKSACPVCHKKQRKCNGTKTGCTYNILHSDVAQQTATSSNRPTRAAAITETDRLSYPQNQHREDKRSNRHQRQLHSQLHSQQHEGDNNT